MPLHRPIKFSDVRGSAQSRKPAEAGPVEAGPGRARCKAFGGSRLRLTIWKALSRGLGRGFSKIKSCRNCILRAAACTERA
jgi:hypothetical protein